MGLLKSAAADAERIAGHRRMFNTKKGMRGGQAATIIMNDDSLKRLIRDLPKRMHNRVLKKATQAAAEIVRIAAEVEIAVVSSKTPFQNHIGDSRKTGTRAKWGASVKRERTGVALNDMSNKIQQKTMPYKKGRAALTMVGADYYANNFGHTHEPLPGKRPANIKLWNTGRRYQLPKRAWLEPAARMTNAMQKQAMKRVIKRAMKNL